MKQQKCRLIIEISNGKIFRAKTDSAEQIELVCINNDAQVVWKPPLCPTDTHEMDDIFDLAEMAGKQYTQTQKKTKKGC